MNPSDSAALSVMSTIAPSLLGAMIWPHLIIIILITAFIIFGCLFLIFKRRNRIED